MTDPLYDIDSEMATCGAMLADNTIISNVQTIVSPDDFHHAQARTMAAEIVAMHAEGLPIDAVTLGHRLGEDYVVPIGTALEKNVRTAHGREYARTVADLALARRELAEAQARIQEIQQTRKPLGETNGKPEAPPAEPYQPFPVDTLPEPVRGYVRAGAAAIGCDPSYIALPLLTMLGAAIGNTRKVVLKSGWSAPPILWTAIIGESGTQKSVGWKLAKKAVIKRQGDALKEHAKNMELYQDALTVHEKRLAEWKRDKTTAEAPPEKPNQPQAVRYVVEDVTVEGLAPILEANPRGLVVSRDELSGWIGSFDQYRSGKGADAANWLSMYNGEALLVDRKTGGTTYVPSAAAAVTGGIQPGILNRALGAEHRESGLMARILMAYPPRQPKRWTEAIIDPETEAAIGAVFDELYGLDFSQDENGEPKPTFLGLDSSAKAAFVEFYQTHNLEMAELTGDLAAADSKLEEIPARLALIFHCVRWAAGESVGFQIDAESMRPAIELTQWHKAETRRVYGLLTQSEEGRERNRLVEWIRGKGGRVTVRQTQQGHRQFKTAEDAELALNDLAKAGFGEWTQAKPKRGPATRVFQLSTPSTVYKFREKPEKNGKPVDCRHVDDANNAQSGWPTDSPPSGDDDDWGTI